MSNLEAHARAELERAGLFSKDSSYDGMLGDAVMKMIKLFADEGHSGMSAPMTIGIFEKLARFEPLGPLTGEDDEWMEIAEGKWQNKRCGHVFKEAEVGALPRAYDIEGRIFREPGGSCFTSYESRVYVTFPYTPEHEYVDVPARGETE